MMFIVSNRAWFKTASTHEKISMISLRLFRRGASRSPYSLPSEIRFRICGTRKTKI